MLHKDLNQILCAALINENFREKLLGDPLATIAKGYEGFSFSLSQEEQQMINGIQANNLEDFCVKVAEWVNPREIKYQFFKPQDCRIAIDLPLPLQDALVITQ